MTTILIISAVLNAVALAVYIGRKVRARRKARRESERVRQDRQDRAERNEREQDIIRYLAREGCISDERAQERLLELDKVHPYTGNYFQTIY